MEAVDAAVFFLGAAVLGLVLAGRLLAMDSMIRGRALPVEPRVTAIFDFWVCMCLGLWCDVGCGSFLCERRGLAGAALINPSHD